MSYLCYLCLFDISLYLQTVVCKDELNKLIYDYLCLFGSSLPPVVCKEELNKLIYVICVCLVRLYPQLFVKRN